MRFALLNMFVAGHNNCFDYALKKGGKMKTIYISSLAVLFYFLTLPMASADSFSFSYSNDQAQTQGSVGSGSKQNGPPDHAPAHGYRAKHMYQYYPAASVYRDAGTGMYFYLSGSNWQVGASLPDALKVRLGSSVSIELDTDKPYIYNKQHREQYPPGQANKQNNKNKNNKKK